MNKYKGELKVKLGKFLNDPVVNCLLVIFALVVAVSGALHQRRFQKILEKEHKDISVFVK